MTRYVRQAGGKHPHQPAVYDSNHPSNVFDPDGGRWVAVCKRHMTLVNSDTLPLAKALTTMDFCDDCRDEDEFLTRDTDSLIDEMSRTDSYERRRRLQETINFRIT